MTRFFDLVTGNNFSLIASGASNTNASKPSEKRAENHSLLESRGARTCSIGKNLRRVNSVDLVTYMSISEVLVKTCSSNATTAKICQKLEVNKIGSSATQP